MQALAKRVSKRLSRPSAASQDSPSSASDSDVEAMLAQWLEEVGVSAGMLAARQAVAEKIRRAHQHHARFATAAEEMEWLEHEAVAARGHGFEEDDALDTPEAVWEAYFRSGNDSDSLRFLDGLGPNVRISDEELSALDSLPEGWHTPGSLMMSNNMAMTSLPRGLHVTGNLELKSDSKLESLPADLQVDGSVTLSACAALANLPDNFHARHDLDIKDMGMLSGLPSGLLVGGALRLSGLRALEAFSADTRVEGDMVIDECNELARFPAQACGGSLRVSNNNALASLPSEWRAIHGDLRLVGCGALESIPPLHVEGSLFMNDCAPITALPEALRVDGGINLAGTAITALPWDALHVRGDLDLSNCTALTHLPADSLRVDGDLSVFFCLALKGLPRALDVRGALDLRSCFKLEAEHFPEEDAAEHWRVDGAVRLTHLVQLTEVPAIFHATSGSLSLRGCTGIAALPAGMSVGGDLSCDGCTKLVQLPADLEVRGSLDLRNTIITAIPAEARLLGDVSLRDCTRLTALPHDMHVMGSLDLFGCSEISTLPRGLKVDKDLNICTTAVAALPDDLEVGAGLNVARTSIRELRSGQHVRGNLDISRTQVRALPDGLVVDGDVNAAGCASLSSLGTAQLGGGVNLRNCVALPALPDGMHIKGKLTVSGCSGLSSLPRDLKVDGALMAHNIDGLTTLPNDLIVGEHMQLDGCSNFTGMRTQPYVGGYLSFTDCTSLHELPEVLDLPDWLFMERCTSLVHMPRELRVQGNLHMEGCSSVEALPEVLHVSEMLYIEGCAGITRLPDCVLEWTMTESESPHNIYLGGSGLPPEELARLQAVDNPALRFHVSINDGDYGYEGGDASDYQSADDFPTLDDAADFWKEQAAAPDVQLPLGVFVEAAYLRGVLVFLSKLRRSKEYTNIDMRKGLASRVVEVLELLTGEDNGVREELLVRMTDSVDACGDKPIWALNQMQLLVQVCKARGDREKLRELGRAVMRLDVVHRHVRTAMAAMSFVDDVCVYLRFEIALREPLDLPVSALDMIYPSYITVTQESIDAAKDEALALNDEDLDAWLPAWSEWQRQDRVEFAEELDFSKLKRNSIKRLSLSLRSLLGNKVADPVRVRPAKAVWSLEDLMKHWINTGMDLNNTPRNVDYMRLNLTKCT